MKKLLVIALMLGLIFIFAIGCTSDSEVEEPPVTYEQEEAVPDEDAISYEMQAFVDSQNSMFEGMDMSELAIAVSAEGTTVTYTYTFISESLYDEVGATTFEIATTEANEVLINAQAIAPEVTTIVIQLVDAEGNVLDYAEFN
ncbi:MAG: DUF4854 domain-containing protein [Coriobacteriia bacterium]|nr:DUF4854 domain-containing protein [Coriobacteriia bacterium]MCL2746567.1 DUF4854 domain-containing protein [Coriobacteriia bacterium]MCL2870209.1 DUF4854 domain-containing protein [Coriobacteriia bacterium]